MSQLLDQRLPMRFWNKVQESEAGCWLWTAAVNPDGYANLIVGSRTDGTRRLALGHVLAYEALVGPVPDGLELDHECNVRRCVRPDHLVPRTHRENVLRGHSPSAKAARATHCPQGHPYDEKNTYLRPGPRPRRGCRICRAAQVRRCKEAQRAAG